MGPGGDQRVAEPRGVRPFRLAFVLVALVAVIGHRLGRDLARWCGVSRAAHWTQMARRIRKVTTVADYPRSMTADIRVRLADAHDLNWLAEHDGHLDALALAAKLARSEVLVAEVDGAPAGLLRFDWLWSSVPFIAQVRVLQPFRRLGVGRALVDALTEQAGASGATLLLSSATGDEPEPQAWHRALGFEECGRLSGINEGDVAEVMFQRRLCDAS